jgi:peptide/nickel transport system substrate-binding protein
MAVLGAVVALGVAACGGGGGNSKSSSSGATPGAGSSSSAAPKTGFNAGLTSVVNPSMAKGGTLKLISSSDCDSLDPARTYYAFCWDLQRIFERTLMAYAAAPGTAGTKLVPDLASAPGTPNANDTVWTYHLRSGIKFQDGSTITSADIKYALERPFATSIIYGGPTYILCLLSKCGSSGAPSYPGPYKDKAGLSSIQTPNASTIIFHLTKPYADWNYIMALPTSAPVPPNKDTGTNYHLKPFASGPYYIASYTPNQQITFLPNKYWSQATDPIRHQLPSEITVTIDSNPLDLDNRLLSGQADIDIGGTGVQAATQAKILSNPTYKADSDNPLTNFVRYFSVDQTVPPLTNIHCRRAIFYAINKSDLQLARGGTFGGLITGQMMPLNIAGASQSLNPYPDGPNNTGDLTKAKAELKLCGHPNGFTVNEAYATPPGKALGVFTASQAALKRVGINVVAKPQAASSYYATWMGSPSNIKKQALGLGQAGWGADFPTGVGFWYAIADGNAIQQTGNSNYPSLNDKVINSDMNKLFATTDESTRASLDASINQQVMQDAVYLPFVLDKALVYRNPEVSNVFVNGAFGIYDFCVMGIKNG